jgi:hypothetical protein
LILAIPAAIAILRRSRPGPQPADFIALCDGSLSIAVIGHLARSLVPCDKFFVRAFADPETGTFWTSPFPDIVNI